MENKLRFSNKFKTYISNSLILFISLFILTGCMTDEEKQVSLEQYNKEHKTDFKNFEDVYEDRIIEVESYEVKKVIAEKSLIFGNSYKGVIKYVTKEGQKVEEEMNYSPSISVSSDKPSTITIRKNNALGMISDTDYIFKDNETGKEIVIGY